MHAVSDLVIRINDYKAHREQVVSPTLDASSQCAESFGYIRDYHVEGDIVKKIN
jgi:hypothetical protein